MNLPNALTVSRLLAIPALMVLLTASFHGHDQVAAIIFVAASLTDTLDGNLARARGQVTELGKFLDPLADKLFILSVLIVLVQVRDLAAWVVVVIFGRELLITVLRSLSATQGAVIAATPWGKTKTVAQVLAVLLLILEAPYPAVQPWATVVVAAAVVFTVLSGVDYVWRFRGVLIAAGPGPQPPQRDQPSDPGTEPATAVDHRVAELHTRLSAAGLKLATAESCTGGLLSAAITDQAGSSAYFLGGVISYSNAVKESELDVPSEVLADFGAVSAQTARAMAEGVRRRLGADIGVAITGIAGPDADGSSKPVGLVHIWVAGPDGSGEGRRFEFAGGRQDVRRQAVAEALELILGRLKAHA